MNSTVNFRVHKAGGRPSEDTQHQQPQTPQTYGGSLRHPVQQHLPQQEIQRTSLLAQAPSSTNNDTLKIAAIVQQIMREFSEAVSEKGNNGCQSS
jgi:hypothetical protein